MKRDKSVHSKLKHEYRISEYEEPKEVHAFQRMYSKRSKKSRGTIKNGSDI